MFPISVTLSVFPGVCASIQSSSDDEFSQKWFSPILTMLLYNFGDTLGRLATAMVQINKRTNSFKNNRWRKSRISVVSLHLR